MLSTSKSSNKKNIKNKSSVISIVDNDGWNKMLKSGKPSDRTIQGVIKIKSIEEDEETKQLREAIEQSIKSDKEYKSQNDIDIEYFTKLSIEEDEETKQLREAIEESIKSHKKYKSPEEVAINLAKHLSMEYNVNIYSEIEFPRLSIVSSLRQ
jgi:tRNA U34 5-carboxymethylaminomethyl modifying enzyme MnmG/GidA